MSEPTTPQLTVLVFTDVVKSVDLKARLGDAAAAALIDRHDQIVHCSAKTIGGAEVLQDTGDGFLLRFATPSDAVNFALRVQWAITHEDWNGNPLHVRIGLHLGEVRQVPSLERGYNKVAGMAVDTTARVMSLAQADQILLTRAAFDSARQNVREHPSADGQDPPKLRWMAHGPYLFQGSAEPVEVFEVGAGGFAPFREPPQTEKARRAVAAGDEITLGWRPAAGLEVPGRPGWVLERKLGEGGFGEVWLGARRKLSQRRVFKFCFDAERLRSFKRELTFFRLLRDALGDRPDIVRLYEVKLDQPPFFLESEYTDGGNLSEWADSQGGIDKVPLSQRIETVAQIADAVAAAHSVGILHKDIKPSNVLIHIDRDGRIVPRLSDFGIGVLVDRAQLAARQITETGFTEITQNDSSRTGTRIYAPPELLTGKAFTVQGDVYALGVLLYQMVVGDLARPLAPGWERDVANELLREDVSACVDGDPAKRLPSAADLAIRLHRFDARREQRRAEAAERERLGTLRIRARRRRRLLVLSSGALLVALVLLSIVAAGLVRERSLHRLADSAKIQADAAAAAEKSARQRADLLAANLRHTLSVTDQQIGHLLGEQNRFQEALAYEARSLREDQNNQAAAVDSVAWLYECPPPLATLQHDGPVRSVVFSPDGTRVVTASDDKTARIWDAATGKPIGEPMRHDSFVSSAAFSSDGTRVITSSGDHAVRIWDAATGNLLGKPLRHGNIVSSCVFSPDGTRVVTASMDNTARIWDAATGTPLGEPMRHDSFVNSAAFSPDGTRVVTASMDNTAHIWDAATGKPIGEPMRHDSFVSSAAFSPDGSRVVTASEDKTARIWDVATDKPLGEPMRHDDLVRSAVFSPDGLRLVTASGKTARIWDAGTGKPLGETMRHDDLVRSAVFSPDGSRLVTASGKTARIWDAGTGKPLGDPLRHDGNVAYAAFSPDGARVATACYDHSSRIWDADTRRRRFQPMRHSSEVFSALFSPDGSRVVTASLDKTVRIWDATTGKPLGKPMRHDYAVYSAVFSPDGTRVVTASHKTARIWDALAAKPIGAPMQHNDEVFSAVFSPDGMRVVTASWDNTARIWDAATGKPLGEPMHHDGTVSSAGFSPDGTRVVTASDDETARIWDASTGKPLGKPMRHDDAVSSAVFSPDGTRVVTASGKTARIWDALAEKLIGEPMRHDDTVHSAAFSPDGTRVVTASVDNTVRIWDVTTGKPLIEPMRHDRAVFSAAFSPDSLRVVTANSDNTLRIWDATKGKTLGLPVRSNNGEVNRPAFSPDGMRLVMTAGSAAYILDLVPAPRDSSTLTLLDELACNCRLQPDDILKKMSRDEWSTLRTDLAASAAPEAPGNNRWAAWFLSDHRHRTVSPLSKLTTEEWVRERVDENTSEGLWQAMEVDPSNALCLARLGRYAAMQADVSSRASAEFYSRRATTLVPQQAEVLWRRAAVLAAIGKTQEGAALADRSPPPADVWGWEAKWDACRLLGRTDDAAGARAEAEAAAQKGGDAPGAWLQKCFSVIEESSPQPSRAETRTPN